MHVNNSRNVILSLKCGTLHFLTKGLSNCKNCQCKHIKVTLDILLTKISKNDKLTPGEPTVTSSE